MQDMLPRGGGPITVGNSYGKSTIFIVKVGSSEVIEKEKERGRERGGRSEIN